MKPNLVIAVAILMCLSPAASWAVTCAAPADSAALPYEDAVQQLRDLGFIGGDENKRTYNNAALSTLPAHQVGSYLQVLRQRQDPSAIFWTKLAGATLTDETQARCFVQHYMLADQGHLVHDLLYLSRLVKKLPERNSFVQAMTNIAQQMSGDAVLAYLQAERAVTFTSGGQGVGSNAANARHNKKKMQHLPNTLMRIMAERLREDDAALRSTIYQVKHMGYRPGD